MKHHCLCLLVQRSVANTVSLKGTAATAPERWPIEEGSFVWEVVREVDVTCGNPNGVLH